MFGVTNQDVFRWPAIHNGIQRQLLGHFITIMLLPGVPKLLWGEEQQFYVLDSTNDNYIFGRQAMSTATAWQTHGCYHLDSSQYYQMPWEATRNGCNDDGVSADHRDPSAPVRNILRRMYHLREAYPVLNDGFFLQQLSNQTWDVTYAGSSGVTTETGLWSVFRSEFPGVQNLTHASGANNNAIFPVAHQLSSNDTASNDTLAAEAATSIWYVYSNLNTSRNYQFDCQDNSTGLNTTSLIAPYPAGTKIKNLFHPFDEHTLLNSTRALGIDGSAELNGCLNSLSMAAYDHRLYVPISDWIGPKPMITKFSPGHDARILSKNIGPADTEDVDIALEFSAYMDCDSVTSSISISSRTENGRYAYIDPDSVTCEQVNGTSSGLVGYVPSTFSWSATAKGVSHGIHRITVDHPRAAVTSTQARINSTTEARDHFLLRVGQANNPMVFVRSANYSSTLLIDEHHQHMLNHSAAGADLYRYSTDFGGSFSDWAPYQGGLTNVTHTGKSAKTWDGAHVRVEYFSRFAGSSSHVQQGDLHSKPRRFPHMYLNGPYNAYGFDAGLDNKFKLTGDYTWEKNFMTEWSNNGTVTQINVWGINPDGQPDQSMVMGDIDGDSVLDRLPPSSLAPVVLNITAPPPKPYVAWRYVVNDGTLRFKLEPVGSMWQQLALYVVLWIVPLLSGGLSTWIFVQSFAKIKFNQIGITEKLGLLSILPYSLRKRLRTMPGEEKTSLLAKLKRQSQMFSRKTEALLSEQAARRRVLIATMEYDIEDWAIKIKIGGT